MVKGTVKWFDNRKGFGFLRCDELCDEDIFVHYSNIEGNGFKCLHDGEEVEFELSQGEKGYHALGVQKFGQCSLDSGSTPHEQPVPTA